MRKVYYVTSSIIYDVILFSVNLPYYCTFENIDFCSLYQSSSDEFNWSIERERTDTLNTGPTRAFEGTYYAYIEASGSNRRPGETAMYVANLQLCNIK